MINVNFNSKYIKKKLVINLIFLCFLTIFQMSCSPTKYYFTVTAPAKSLNDLKIPSIQVFKFNVLSNYGKNEAIQLKGYIENEFIQEGYIRISNNSQYVLIGDIEFSRVNYDSNSKCYKGGCTYTYQKKYSVTGNYSLFERFSKVKVFGDSIQFFFDMKWRSGDSYSDAKSRALSDEKIIFLALNQIARQIVSEISPHKETIHRELRTGKDDNIELGITYLVNGRTDQAVSIWDKVIETTSNSVDKAAAYYNIGVVKEAQGFFKDAFELYSKANELEKEDELYMKAMTRVENSYILEQKAKEQIGK